MAEIPFPEQINSRQVLVERFSKFDHRGDFSSEEMRKRLGLGVLRSDFGYLVNLAQVAVHLSVNVDIWRTEVEERRLKHRKTAMEYGDVMTVLEIDELYMLYLLDNQQFEKAVYYAETVLAGGTLDGIRMSMGAAQKDLMDEVLPGYKEAMFDAKSRNVMRIVMRRFAQQGLWDQTKDLVQKYPFLIEEGTWHGLLLEHYSEKQDYVEVNRVTSEAGIWLARLSQDNDNLIIWRAIYNDGKEHLGRMLIQQGDMRSMCEQLDSILLPGMRARAYIQMLQLAVDSNFDFVDELVDICFDEIERLYPHESLETSETQEFDYYQKVDLTLDLLSKVRAHSCYRDVWIRCQLGVRLDQRDGLINYIPLTQGKYSVADKIFGQCSNYDEADEQFKLLMSLCPDDSDELICAFAPWLASTSTETASELLFRIKDPSMKLEAFQSYWEEAYGTTVCWEEWGSLMRNFELLATTLGLGRRRRLNEDISLKDILDGDTNPDDFKTVSASFGSFVMTNMRESDDEMSLGEASNQSIAIFLRSLVLVAAEQNQWQVVLQMLNDTRFSDNEVAQLLNKLIHDYQ